MILRIRLPAADADVLDRLQEGRCSGYARQFGTQLIDDLRCAVLPLIERLQCDEREATVGRSLAAGKGHHILHAGIVLDDADRLLNCAAHGVERGVLRTLHAPLHHSCVLLREESLRNLQDEKDI